MKKRTFYAAVDNFRIDRGLHDIEPVPGEHEKVETRRGFSVTLRSWGEIPDWDTLPEDLRDAIRSSKLKITIEEAD
jgi:hypothetical protein